MRPPVRQEGRPGRNNELTQGTLSGRSPRRSTESFSRPAITPPWRSGPSARCVLRLRTRPSTGRAAGANHSQTARWCSRSGMSRAKHFGQTDRGPVSGPSSSTRWCLTADRWGIRVLRRRVESPGQSPAVALSKQSLEPREPFEKFRLTQRVAEAKIAAGAERFAGHGSHLCLFQDQVRELQRCAGCHPAPFPVQ